MHPTPQESNSARIDQALYPKQQARGQKELTNRCSMDAVLKARKRECCRKMCVQEISAEQMLEDRRLLATDGARSRDRQERAECLWRFCGGHGMIRRMSSEEGKFQPMLYNKPICWDGLAYYLGVGNGLLREIRQMAESGCEIVKQRYDQRKLAASTVRVHVCDFMSHIFCQIGEYQPDRASIILPFPSMQTMISYLSERWGQLFDPTIFPTSRTIRRYMR